jgi:hypothetical protein
MQVFKQCVSQYTLISVSVRYLCLLLTINFLYEDGGRSIATSSFVGFYSIGVLRMDLGVGCSLFHAQLWQF